MTSPLEPNDTDSKPSLAQLGDFSAELGDPWPVIERLRMALREAERWCAGDTNITAHCIIDLIDRLPNNTRRTHND